MKRISPNTTDPRATPPSISQRSAGHLPDGREVHEYTLCSGPLGMRVLTLGGIVSRLLVPDREGVLANVVLGFEHLDDYIQRNPNFGVIVGRYGNRIANASFELDGQRHALTCNDGTNCLHGGARGFGKQLWQAQAVDDAVDAVAGTVSLTLAYTSPAGEEGFPGCLQTRVSYTLSADTFSIHYEARTDAPTVLNLTHHDYFNLAGPGSALGHRLQVQAARFLAIDDNRVPAAVTPVDGTPFDFRQPRVVESRLRDPHPQLGLARGYDHSWLLDGQPDADGLRQAAVLTDPHSGRRLTVLTTEPALQVYTANFLDGRLVGSGGQRYRPGDAVCLEAQHSPDSPNHDSADPDWPSTVLRPGEVFRSRTLHRFDIAG